MPDVPAPDDLLAIEASEIAALQQPALPAGGGPGLCAGLTVGPYRLERCIGAGGMGEVYRAVHVDGGAPAAVKLLRGAPWLSGAALERFQREARIARSLDHRNVVAVHDVGEFNGTWWIAMELVEGRTLHDWVVANGPLPWRLALRIAAQASAGLQAAHDNCVVHRDVKPANVLCSPDGRVRLADFGIALDAETTGRLTLTGQAIGTPAFMSPEQCTGSVADARSDIYSLGATLFYAVTGRPPFVGGGAGEGAGGHLTLFEQQVRHAAPRADRLNPGVPAAVGRVIAKCLSKPPGARYQLAAAFTGDCAAILAGQDPALREGDDTSVRYTRAFIETDPRDSEVERCIAMQEAAHARGERPAPLGELLAREGAVAFRPRADRVAARTDGALRCAECGAAAGDAVDTAGAWPPGPCAVCSGVLITATGVAVGEAFGRVILVPGGTQARSAAVCTRDLLPLLGVAVQSGSPHVAVDCSPIGRLDSEHAVWIAEAVELVLAEGGSLALIVPDDRARQLLATVGVDQYARVVETRIALATARPGAPAPDHTPDPSVPAP